MTFKTQCMSTKFEGLSTMSVATFKCLSGDDIGVYLRFSAILCRWSYGFVSRTASRVTKSFGCCALLLLFMGSTCK